MKKTKLQLWLMSMVLAVICFSAMPAWAELAVAPLRVVFQGRDRSAVVSLINLSDHVNTYRVGWTIYKMNEDGGYTTMQLDSNDPFSVDKMIIFTPRQVVIRPDQHQIVRLSLRRPANLPLGEYRGHLTFTRLPPQKKQEANQSVPKKGQSISLDVNMSFSIPVIIRNGDDSNLKVQVANPKFDTQNRGGTMQPVLNLDLERVSGNYSTYGFITAYWQAPGAKEEQKIGVLNNVALYPEVKKRRLSLLLYGPRVQGGNIRVVYQGKYESAGTIWDEKVFPVGAASEGVNYENLR